MKVLAVISTLVILLSGCSLPTEVIDYKQQVVDNSNWRTVQRPDGAKCWVLFGGTHAGVIGISCKQTHKENH